MINHYYWPTPNGHKTAIMLEEIEIDYKIFPIDIHNGEQFDAEFREFSGGSAQALVTSGLLQGYEVKPVPLLFFNHTRGLNHAPRSTSSLTSV